jgi:hypothetical protein
LCLTATMAGIYNDFRNRALPVDLLIRYNLNCGTAHAHDTIECNYRGQNKVK